MKHLIAVTIVLALTAAAHVTIHTAQARATGAHIESDVDLPATIMSFRQSGADMPVDESVTEMLETNSVLMRQYIAPSGLPVQLAVVTGKTRRSLHFPEVCFVGQGYEVREQYSAPVGVLFMGKRLVLTRGEREEAVLYWFKTGNNLTGSYLENSAHWTWEQVMFRAPLSSLIRVSTPITSQGQEAAFRLLDDFATSLVPYLVEQA